MTYADMIEMTNSNLVVVYNELATELEGVEPLKGWKSAKTKLIERIEGLQAQIEDAKIDAEDDDDEDFEVAIPERDDELTSINVDSETFEQIDGPIEEPKGEPIPDEAGEEPKRTIKSMAVDLLCSVVYHEDRDEKSNDENRVEANHPKARSVGIAYDEVIRRIQEEFDGCNTSVACLRWYSVKIRVGEHGYEDLRLPQRRPRAKPRTSN